MDARTFFGLEPDGGDRTRWRMEVVRGLTSGTGALFGGCGLGACIEVMEQVTGRPPMSVRDFVALHAEAFGGRRS